MSNNLRNLPMLFIVSLSAFCGFEPERHVKPREHSRAWQATRNDIAQTAQIVVSGDDKNARCNCLALPTDDLRRLLSLRTPSSPNSGELGDRGNDGLPFAAIAQNSSSRLSRRLIVFFL